MRPTLILLLSVGLAGCSSGIDGVWSMQIPFSTAETCVTTLSHNFTGATEIGAGDTTEDDGWTETESDDRSNQLVFVQIETTGKDQGLLIMGAEAWPGIETSKGQWTFTWEGTQDSSSDATHDSGYEFTAAVNGTSLDEIQLALDGGIGGGTWTASTTFVQAWTESDSWSEELGFRTGRIPSADYLEREATGGPGGTAGPTPTMEAAINDRDLSDCDAGLCQLSITDQCDLAVDVTLLQTDYSTEDVYEYLDGTGQPFGL